MGAQPLVSVIIPTFNAERWIRATLESVLQQTYSNIEIIVVDDVSTDATLAAVATFGPRVRVLRNTQNSGVSTSRNTALRLAQGNYIAFFGP